MTNNKELLENLKIIISNTKLEILKQEKKLDELINQLNIIKGENTEE